MGFDASAASSPREVAEVSQLIVTTTPSRRPLLEADWIKPGTHITAVGSDIPEKQELDVQILKKADRVVGDSLSQCQHRGEIHKALEAGVISGDDAIELGRVLSGQVAGRRGQCWRTRGEAWRVRTTSRPIILHNHFFCVRQGGGDRGNN